MASGDSSCKRHSNRTFSEGASSGGEEDQEGAVIRIPSRISESSYDINSIVEIVTCSIHLGIMEEPKKLHCQHAFCRHCLNNLLKSNVTLLCPVCRAEESINDVDSLPQALVEKQLIDIVMRSRISECKTPSSKEDPVSKKDKEELVKYLLKELDETNSQIFKFDDPKDNDEVFNESSNTSLRIRTSNDSSCSSTFDMMDIETIRENMYQYSCYKEVKRDCITKFFKNNRLKMHGTPKPDLSTFDIHRINDQPETYEIIFVDSETNKFFVYSEMEFRSFYIRLQDTILKPVYIRIIHGDLFVTGIIAENETQYGIFLQCNLYGKVIRKTNECRWVTSARDSTLPLICGFDVEENKEKFFLCMPNTNSINVYNTSLIESRQSYDFDNNQPEYVTLQKSHNQMWVSCPRNQKILIADIDTGGFMMFGTDLINQAIPKMIYCTDDDRVIFLDSESNKFIWIKRRGEYILIQKLHFRSINEDLPVKAFQVLPFSLIVVGTSKEFMVFQPIKSKLKVRTGLSSCMII